MFIKLSELLKLLFFICVLSFVFNIYYVTLTLALDLEGQINVHGREKEEFEKRYKELVLYLTGDSSGDQFAKVQIGGNFFFRALSPNEEIKISWDYSSEKSREETLSIIKPYIIFPQAKSARSDQIAQSNLSFLFRRINWIHDFKKAKIMESIRRVDFKSAEDHYAELSSYYHMSREYGYDTLHYGILNEMCSELLEIVKIRRNTVTQKKDNIRISRCWISDLLNNSAEEGSISKNPNRIIVPLVTWNTFALKAYSMRMNWPSKSFKQIESEVNIPFFREDQCKDYLQQDLILIQDIFSIQNFSDHIKRLISSVEEEGDSLPFKEFNIVQVWEREIKNKSYDEIDLNMLANTLTGLNKLRMRVK